MLPPRPHDHISLQIAAYDHMPYISGGHSVHQTPPKSGHLYLSGAWLGVDLRMDTKKEHNVFKRDQITCLKYVYYSRLNSQHHNCKGLNDHLMSTGILNLIMNKMFI